MDAIRKYDPYVRGTKERTPTNTSVLSLLRGSSPLIQYYLLTSPLLPSFILRCGGDALPQLPAGWALTPGRWALLSLSIGAAVKHAVWAAFLNQERLHGASAISIGLVNITFDSLASLLYLWRATCPAGPAEELTPVMLIAIMLGTIGLGGELAAEIERHRFKQSSRNRGKLYTRGLWAWTRHPNYAGYILWRFGHAMACMGYLGIFVALATHAADIGFRAIPINEQYCRNKYAAQFRTYQKRTPYKLFPYIY